MYEKEELNFFGLFGSIIPFTSKEQYAEDSLILNRNRLIKSNKEMSEGKKLSVSMWYFISWLTVFHSPPPPGENNWMKYINFGSFQAFSFYYELKGVNDNEF